MNVDSIKSWLRWIHYLSVFYYAFEAMITSELNGTTFELTVRGGRGTGAGRGGAGVPWTTRGEP